MRPKLSRVWVWGASVAAAVPLLFARHLPLSDLPEHVAAIATLAHYSDASWRSAEYFQVQGVFRTTYLLYHAVGALFATALGSAERANTLLLVLTALAMVPSLAALLRAVRGEERLALVAGPLFWNRALAERLLNYVASIPVALGALALSVRHARAPSRKSALTLGLAAAVLFYLHTSSFAVLLVGATGAAWIFRRAAPRASLAVRFPVAACALLLGPVLVVSNVIAARSGGEHAGVVRFLPTRLLVLTLFGWMHDVWTSPWDDAAAKALWALVLAMLLSSAASAGRPRRHRRLAWFFAALGPLFYFLLPNQVSYAFILELRTAPYIGLLGVLLVAPRRGFVARLAAAGLLGVNVLYGALGAASMARFEREEASHFDLVLRNLPPGRRLLTLVFHTPSEHVIITPFVHFGAYYRARYGGVAGFSFSELPHWPVTYRPELAPPKKDVTFWDWNPCLFRNSKDGPYYDFVLVRGDVEPFVDEPAGPRWRVIGVAKDWVLYEKTASPYAAGDDRGPCPDAGWLRGLDSPGGRVPR